MKPLVFACGLAALAGPALAAGGHHDVDDATVLDPGHCQVETWALSGRGPSLAARHLGPACNLGGLEWGLNIDRVRQDGLAATSLGPQLKWVADPAARRLSVGLVGGLTWRSGGPRRPVGGVYLPATLWLGGEGQWQLHANLGHDDDPGNGRFRRWGTGVDWVVNDRWVFTAERRALFGQQLSRAGLRFNLTPLASTDLSLARGGDARVVALGFNWEWVP